METRFTIDGARELERLLKDLGPEVGSKVALQALRASARSIQRELKARAPTGKQDPHPKYGRLKDNIRVTTVEKNPPEFEVVVHTGSAFWGHFLEFGTVKMRPHPWFSPVWDASVQAALETLGKNMSTGISREARKLAGTYGRNRRR